MLVFYVAYAFTRAAFQESFEFWISFLICIFAFFPSSYCKNLANSCSEFPSVLKQAECCFLVTTSIFFFPQVLVRNVPPDTDESVSEHIEHFFCVNHPDHYMMHQVCSLTTTTNSVANM